MNKPTFFKRIASMFYESVLVFAILFVAGIIYRAIFGDPQNAFQQHLFFAYSWIITGFYFVFCWVKNGQTLAMQTWRIQLLGQNAQPLPIGRAIVRYVVASFSLMFFGLGFVWAIFDREGLYLHDRFTSGHLISLPKQ